MRLPRAAPGRGSAIPFAPPQNGPAPPPPPSPGRRNREIFLGLFVRYPALIEPWVEEIAATEFPEAELDRLRRAILEVAESSSGLDATSLEQHLALCGHAQIISTLAITLSRHAGFAAGGGDDLEVIRQGLKEILQLLNAQGRSDVDAAREAFAVDPSAENSQRLTAVKERQFQDGPVGGVG